MFGCTERKSRPGFHSSGWTQRNRKSDSWHAGSSSGIIHKLVWILFYQGGRGHWTSLQRFRTFSYLNFGGFELNFDWLAH